MNLLEQFISSFRSFQDHRAFCIADHFFTYKDLFDAIAKIQSEVQFRITKEQNQVGLVLRDDLETYASIFALWFEGKAYVPINPKTPYSRNLNILEQAEIKIILDSSSSETMIFDSCQLITTSGLIIPDHSPEIKKYSENSLAYILFTSGTTGIPKGVPITHGNLKAFMEAYWNLDYPITDQDRCLQMFDLTFDMSVVSMLAPLLRGACLYTVPSVGIKYLEVMKILTKQKITYANLVPSVIHSLRPYFHKINLPDLKYCFFAGEALYEDITKAWSNCAPNAVVANIYGPTEFTIVCTHYQFDRKNPNVTHHGIISIGKAMKDTITILVDENNIEVPPGIEGELCLSGPQITPGYWKNEEANKKAFFQREYMREIRKFYKTGDLCKTDEAGQIIYIGRIDFQAKVQGHRIELSEIEFYAKKIIQNTNLVTVLYHNKSGNAEIALVIESKPLKTEFIIKKLKEQLPLYMIPSKILFFDSLPLNVNGKINRKEIINRIEAPYV